MTETKLQIPGYEILGEVGKGAMGVVYKARQTSVDRVVAVKVLRDSAARDEEFLRRFRGEAKTAAKLSHPNIVNAIDAGEAEGRHFFVMEYVEGTTAEDALKKGKLFNEAAALRVAKAIALALKHAHARGMVHRDIKPANIMLTKDGGIKLADLGLARVTADTEANAVEAGLAAGTPYYISPEQARGLADVDIRSDIYSLGATLYHVVTGRPPYTGATPTEVMRKHVSKKSVLTPPDHVNTNLSSGFGEVVETMLSKDRDARYRTPDDLILDIDCLLRGERPKIAGHRDDTLSSLADGDTQDDFVAPAGRDSSRSASGPGAGGPAVLLLSLLLGISVLLNVVQFLGRR
jgi:serine/threonine-protein kinase